MFDEFLDKLSRNKELKVGFLVDVAILWTPAKDRVRGLDAIGHWLRINRQQHVCVQRRQHIPYVVRLNLKGALRERELLYLASHILYEDLLDIDQALNLLSPELTFLIMLLLFGFLGEGNETFLFSLEGGRERSSPSAVGKIVPSLRPINVALLVVCPEDGANLLAFATIDCRFSKRQVPLLIYRPILIDNLQA